MSQQPWIGNSSSNSDEDKKYVDSGFATRAIHIGNEPDPISGAVVPPISMATTFRQRSIGDFAFEYGRTGNPTRERLERCLASLENARYCVCLASGMAATVNIAHLLKAGDHVLSMDDVYGGVNRYYRQVLQNFAIEVDFIDMTNVDKVRASLKKNTRLVWMETPTNPLLKIVDISAVCAVVKEHEEKTGEKIITVVDNTFVSPYFQKPIDLGATISMHSMTKYLNGHTDVVMGCVMLNDTGLYERLKYLQNAMGCVPSPFDCFLVLRGLKTLAVRMEKHQQNGLAVANYLLKSPRVLKTIYPGSETHPGHAIAKRQQSGFSGMVSFHIKGGLEAAQTFLKSLKMITLAESLGGYETLAEHPGLMTHAAVPEHIRRALGYGDDFVRISVGIEDIHDIIADLDQALKTAVP